MIERATSTNTSNKRIAKNVLYLYIRLFLMLIVGLYTSRIVLDRLGSVDYGLYGVVGSLVAIFTFVTGALSSSASRFMAVEVEVGTPESQNKVFCMTLNIHLLFSAIVVLVAETLGLWYLNNKMVIPEGREYASAVVYQLSCICALFSILVVPYRALIIANEHMKAFAYLSIIEVVAKLCIAFCLYGEGADRLILYGLLSCIVQIGVNLSYYVYCRRKYVESYYYLQWNRSLFKEMIAFTGWSAYGTVSSSLINQCYNLLLNLFFSPIVNAARTIAYQVQTKITQFATNFQVALNPQLVKNFSANDIRRVEELVVMSMKISFSLMLIMLFPILTNIDGLLSLWLVDVPDNTAIFVVMVCVTQIFGSMSNPFGVVAEAANRVKKRVLIVVPFFVIGLPVSYICLSHGLSALSVFVVTLIINLVVLWVEYYIARSIIGDNMRDTFLLICKCIGSLCFFVGVAILLRWVFDTSLLSVLLCGAICLLLSVLWVLYVIISRKERAHVYNKVRSYIGKR